MELEMIDVDDFFFDVAYPDEKRRKPKINYDEMKSQIRESNRRTIVLELFYGMLIQLDAPNSPTERNRLRSEAMGVLKVCSRLNYLTHSEEERYITYIKRKK